MSHRRRYMLQKRSQRSSNRLLEDTFVTRHVVSIDGADAELSLAEIYRYISALQPAVEKWFQIFNPDTIDEKSVLRPWLDKLNRLGSHEYLPLILAILLSEEPDIDKVEVLKKIEQHNFISNLLDYNYHFYSSGNFLEHAVKLYRGESKPKQVAKLIADDISHAANSKAFVEAVRKNFKSSGFYKWNSIRYFLYEYNLHLQERSKTERKKLDWRILSEKVSDYKTVEHIFPQKARAKYWTERFSGMTPGQRKSLINSLGNLLPL